MDELLAGTAWLVAELVLIRTGRLVISAASRGRWRGENVQNRESRIHGPAGALSFKHKGQRVVTVTGLLIVGVVFYVVVIAALLFAVYA